MNPEYMCIEEAEEPLPFQSQFEKYFWDSVSQDNNSMHSVASAVTSKVEHLEMSSFYKDGKIEPFTEAVSN